MNADRLRSFGARSAAIATAERVISGGLSLKSVRASKAAELRICLIPTQHMLARLAADPAKAKRIEAILSEPEGA